MPEAGWYPDPGGRPGHYRFWDGQTWAPTTSTDPAFSGPPSGDDRGGSPRRSGRRGLVAGLAALVLVLVVVAALVVRDRTDVADPGPVPSSSATAAGPSPSTTPSTRPRTSPTLPASSSPRAVRPSAGPCPVGNPDARRGYPEDGRVHGGRLSFPRQAGWSYPGRQAGDFLWAYDVGETDTPIEPTWYASYAVGALSVADGFEDPRSAAELTMACTVSSTLYRHVTSRTDLVSEESSIDGYQAWTIRSEIRAEDDRTSFEGATVQVTVVDLGSAEALAFFWGCAPIGELALAAQLDEVAGDLQVG